MKKSVIKEFVKEINVNELLSSLSKKQIKKIAEEIKAITKSEGTDIAKAVSISKLIVEKSEYFTENTTPLYLVEATLLGLFRKSINEYYNEDKETTASLLLTLTITIAAYKDKSYLKVLRDIYNSQLEDHHDLIKCKNMNVLHIACVFLNTENYKDFKKIKGVKALKDNYDGLAKLVDPSALELVVKSSDLSNESNKQREDFALPADYEAFLGEKFEASTSNGNVQATTSKHEVDETMPEVEDKTMPEVDETRFMSSISKVGDTLTVSVQTDGELVRNVEIDVDGLKYPRLQVEGSEDETSKVKQFISSNK